MVAGLEDLPRNWLKVPLALITKEFISGGTPSTKRKDMWDGSIPWTTSASIDEDAVVLEEGQRLITERALADSATNLVPTGNLLIGTRVGVGKAVVNLVDIAISQDLTGLVVDHHIVDPVFVAYQFKTERIKEFFLTRIRGTTIKGISRFDLQSLELLLPPIDEQRAIVSCLDQVRAAIRTRRRELALERERKAALMDYLFTHGTRGEPTKQTEIGEIPESWQVVRLGEVAYLISGGTPSKERDDWWAGLIPWVSPKDLKQPRLRDVVDHISLEAVEVGSRLAPAGTVFIVIRGMILAKDVPVSLAEVPMAFNQDLKGIVPRQQLLGEFLLNALEWRKDGLFSLTGTSAHGTRRIGTSALESFLIPLPEMCEQQTVSDALRACDEKIDALGRELELLQQLFVSLLESLMTGKVQAVFPISLGRA